ncbi:FUSC family protein [Halomonas pacifica]|uniref:FUSC family protein n=1 Tax=Bisbaumannia pacifica TaxID=77098 RepID=A0A510X7Q0_9GAMM|nr:FUSC family protein [Halomonas pacifica]MDC8803852.1 FUSC family protein [Halomonas pacifica]GEK47468.1 FUSC family protein [Halomonas pacifica]
MRSFRLRDPYVNYRHRRPIHALRICAAVAITYLIITLLPIPHGSWALVSTAMVMGNLPHIGGVLDKAKQRLLGTVTGVGWGVLITLVPDPPPGLLLGWLLLGIALATYITFGKRHAYGGLMFTISLLLVAGDGHQDLTLALWRGFDVLLGTCVGLTVTLLLLPQKATDVLRFLMADNLETMARLYQAHTGAAAGVDPSAREALKTTSGLLVKQRGLIDAIHSEGRLRRRDLDSLISLQRRMLSTIELLLESHWNTRSGHERIDAMTGLRETQHSLARVLGSLAYQVRTGQPIQVDGITFDLQRYGDQAQGGRTEDGRLLFSPSGYLWLNRELARLTQTLAEELGKLRRLPSQRLRRRAARHPQIIDKTKGRP